MIKMPVNSTLKVFFMPEQVYHDRLGVITRKTGNPFLRCRIAFLWEHLSGALRSKGGYLSRY